MFDDADILPDIDTERDALFDQCQWVETDVDNEGNMIFIKGDGSYYQQGHGHEKCARFRCMAAKDVPTNCGFNTSEWSYPRGFQSCGEMCSGAFCDCIRKRNKYKELNEFN